jgi:hypothetical protein
VQNNGNAGNGILQHSAPGTVHQTGKTAAIATSTLCASAAGACNQAGQYRIVAVEKLVAPKFAKIKSRQDALQTTFSVFLDIFYPLKFGCFGRKVSFSTATPVI